MTSVLSYTPSWLSRPSAGFDFLSEADSSNRQRSKSTHIVNKRLASIEASDGNGAQILFATGNELRWADVHLLEEAGSKSNSSTSPPGWRVLKIPVARPIQQIVVSPDQQLLAIATTHTCHVCILPPRSHLSSGDTTPLKVKAFQVGPTAHVLEQSPIASILWHPLSISGIQTLVTVTKDASVRLWELDVNNRHSFDQAEFAIDLKKLANATSVTTDVTASRFGVNRTFSPDDAEMEVVAACFGGRARHDEQTWASMTLWTAMSEGDIYALCPILPSRFALPQTALPNLRTGIIARAELNAQDTDVKESELRNSNDQSLWLADLDSQDVITAADDDLQVYSRPQRPAPVPKLQGPFELSWESSSLNITDIHVVAPTIINSPVMDHGHSLSANASGEAGIGIVCLATNEGKIHISASLEAVSAKWLPLKHSRAIALDDSDITNELLVLQTADLGAAGRPAFTPSPVRPYEVFVTSASGVHALDFGSLLYALEDELAGDGSSGTDFRLQILFENTTTIARTILTSSADSELDSDTTALAIEEPSLGLLLVTSTSSGPHAAILDGNHDTAFSFEPEPLALPAPEPRESYQPSPAFFQTSEIVKSMAAQNNNPVIKAELAQNLRAKPGTLQLFTETHRVLSQETHRLGIAAADLFRRCERMRVELADQVEKVKEISERTQAAINGDTPETDQSLTNEDTSVDAIISGRILQIQSNSKDMEERIKALRSDILRLGGDDLSVRERAYLQEVHQLQTLIGIGSETDSIQAPTQPSSILHLPDHAADAITGDTHKLNGHSNKSSTFTTRLVSAEQLKDSLIDAVDGVVEKQSAIETVTKPSGSKTDIQYKNQKLAHVLEMLEREMALIDAVTERLSRLSA